MPKSSTRIPNGESATGDMNTKLLRAEEEITSSNRSLEEVFQSSCCIQVLKDITSLPETVCVVERGSKVGITDKEKHEPGMETKKGITMHVGNPNVFPLFPSRAVY